MEEGECDGTIDLTGSSQEDIGPPGEEVTSLLFYLILHESPPLSTHLANSPSIQGEVKEAVAGEELVLPEPTPALIIQPVGSGVIAKTDEDGTGGS